MRCARHPEAEAQWECSRCQRWHCEACVRRVAAGTGRIEACAHCDGLLRRAVIAAPAPREQLLDALRRPFTPDGAITAFALAAPAWISALPLGFVWTVLCMAVYVGAFGSYYFMLADHVGRGRGGLPMPSEAVEGLSTLARPLLCLLVFAAPFIVWEVLGGSMQEVGRRPILVAGLVAIGIALLPGAILATLITHSALAAAWPVFWVRIIARAPASYARLVALFVASGAAWWVVTLLGAFFLGKIPLFGGLLVTAAGNLILMAQAALVGNFLRRNADDFGYA